MSIKARLMSIEKKAGGHEPLHVFLRTFDETGERYSRCVIVHGGKSEHIHPHDGETTDEFKARVHGHELTGQ